MNTPNILTIVIKFASLCETAATNGGFFMSAGGGGNTLRRAARVIAELTGAEYEEVRDILYDTMDRLDEESFYGHGCWVSVVEFYSDKSANHVRLGGTETRHRWDIDTIAKAAVRFARP